MVIRCTRAAARAGACLAVILCVAVAPFTVAKGMDVRLGRRAADHVRSRVCKLSDHHEVDVIDGADIDEALARARPLTVDAYEFRKANLGKTM